MDFLIKKMKIGNFLILNSILSKNFNNIANKDFLPEEKI
jgi:hypothetical protein